MENVLFELYIGNTYTRDISITNFPEEIEEIYFTVKENDNDKRVKLQKTLNDGITLVDEEEATQVYNLLLDPDDTNNLKTNKEYTFDIHVVSENIEKTIVTGLFYIKNHSTKSYNERSVVNG